MPPEVQAEAQIGPVQVPRRTATVPSQQEQQCISFMHTQSLDSEVQSLNCSNSEIPGGSKFSKL